MSTQPYQHEMSVEAFFQFCQEHPEERYEYIHGYAYRLMAGGDSNHSRIKINLTGELRNALRGRSCLVFDSDMHVRIDESLYVLPDASVSCDERDHGYVQTLRHPCLVIEVLSPSTKNSLLGTVSAAISSGSSRCLLARCTTYGSSTRASFI